MSEGAQRRSIDEIIGSIRSIVDRDNARVSRPLASNDAVADELTEPPASPIHPVAFAEPVAPRTIEGDAIDLPPFAHVSRVDRADRERMAEIARTVSDNIPHAAASHDVHAHDVHYAEDAGEAVDVAHYGAADEAEFGGVADGYAPDAEIPSELPVHERLRDLHQTVASEHTVAMRGVTVQAANDVAPVAETVVPPLPLPEVMMGQLGGAVAAAVPALLPQPAPAAPPSGGNLTELDEAVLRPIIREWLDDNLPPVVERLVREELHKAIGGKK